MFSSNLFYHYFSWLKIGHIRCRMPDGKSTNTLQSEDTSVTEEVYKKGLQATIVFGDETPIPALILGENQIVLLPNGEEGVTGLLVCNRDLLKRLNPDARVEVIGRGEVKIPPYALDQVLSRIESFRQYAQPTVEEVAEGPSGLGETLLSVFDDHSFVPFSPETARELLRDM